MPKVHTTVFPKTLFAAIRHDRPHIQVSQIVIESAVMGVADVAAQALTASR